MLSVADARQRLLDALPTCGVETVGLQSVFGRVLAEDIVANKASPRFDNSSMDGFAIHAEDTQPASQARPIQLKVIEDIPAGTATETVLKPGQAMRIMTGAALPAGSDAVIPVEDTDAAVAQPGAELPPTVQIRRIVKAGDFVRPAGEDFRAGDVLITAGKRVRAQEAALLALLGETKLKVHRKPRVAILSSGDELLKPDEPIAPGKIRETNSVSLGALVESSGAEARWLGIARDTLQDVTAHLDRAVDGGADLILSSAGVSVGAFDYLREAVTRNGALDFWKVNMRPGKPFAFGQYRGIPYVGLPGNPVSSFVGFEVFLRPALSKMGGIKNWSRLVVQAHLKENVYSDGRESYLRCNLENSEQGPLARLTGHQGSGNLYSLVQANALLRVPAGVTELSRESQAEVWPF